MKLMKKSFLSLFIAISLIFSLMQTTAIAAKPLGVPADLDKYTETLQIDYDKPQLQPLTGYFTEKVGENRTIKLYIPSSASLRARFTAIAVPNGVDTWEFLSKQGWIKQADKHRECLFILEPGTKGWGSIENEEDYIAKAMNVLLTTKNNNGISVFSTHSTFAAVGYDTGCAVLESWTVKNPLYIYAQVFINGESVGDEYLVSDGRHTYTSYKDVSEHDFINALETMGLTKNSASLRSEIPVPTWFTGYADDDPSVSYWISANDCLKTPDANGIYHQDINSDAWQTAYANANIKNWNQNTPYGLSVVKTTSNSNISASKIFDFTSHYTRYTTLWAYSNNLATHMNYDNVIKAAIISAKKGTKKTYNYTDFYGKDAISELRALKSTRVKYDNSPVGGKLYAGAMAVKDYDKNGTKDPREFLVYVPDTYKKHGKNGAPLIMVHPGMTQTAQTFIDCSGLVPIANDEGCILIIITQPYRDATTVAYAASSRAYLGDDLESSNFARALMAFMKTDFDETYADIDFSRVYASGHSAGSYVSETLALVSDNSWIAAVGSTSFITRSNQLANGIMPTYLLVGHSDINDYRVDLVQDPYVSKPTVEGTTTGLNSWIKRVLKMNDIKASFIDDDRNSFINSCSDTNLNGTRYLTYKWNNDQDINLVTFGRTLLRQHNCYPEEFRLIWDYLEHFKVVKNADGTISRYYSESAFQIADDTIEIIKD